MRDDEVVPRCIDLLIVEAVRSSGEIDVGHALEWEVRRIEGSLRLGIAGRRRGLAAARAARGAKQSRKPLFGEPGGLRSSRAELAKAKTSR